MFFDDFCFKDPPNLLVGAGYNWFEENIGKNLRGIYAAVCLDNEKIYIGSSKDFQHRWKRGHMEKLKKGKHDNKSLQHSYDKYGEESIFWYWVEDLDLNQDLLKVEYYNYIEPLVDSNPSRRRIFNHQVKYLDMAKSGDSWAQNRRFSRISAIRGTDEPRRIKDPYGEIHEFYCSIRDFAEEKGINRKGLGDILRGKSKYLLGWCLPETPSIPLKIHKLEKIQTGEIFEFVNMSQFARENQCSITSISSILNGVTKGGSGFKLPETVLKNKIYKLKNRETNDIVEFTSIKEFSFQNGLIADCVESVLGGRSVSYKGWCLPDSIQKVWTFISPDGREVNTTNLTKFRKENGLNIGEVNKLRSIPGASCMGWTFKFIDLPLPMIDYPVKIIERRSKKRREYVKPSKLRSPEGLIVRFTNPEKFARDNGLDLYEILSVLTGDKEDTGGWKNAKVKNKIENCYILEKITTGEVVRFSSKADFARENNMPRESVNNLLKGKTKISNGFKLVGVEIPESKIRQLKNPVGEIVEFKNLAQFSRENDLVEICVRALFRGQLKSYKGWTLPSHDIPSWTFVDPYGEEFVVTNLAEFARNRDINKQILYNLTRERGNKISEGWTLKK